jgi:hypothetical protein
MLWLKRTKNCRNKQHKTDNNLFEWLKTGIELGANQIINTELGANQIINTEFGANQIINTELGANQSINTEIGASLIINNELGANQMLLFLYLLISEELSQVLWCCVKTLLDR